MKYDVLLSIMPVIETSKYVKINKNRIGDAVALLNPQVKQPWLDNNYLDLDKYTIEERILFMLICESLNFCYWEKPKWKIEYKNNWYSGSFGLFYGIARAIQNGYEILNLEKLKDLSLEELDEMLKGTRSIPLLKERYDILKQLVSEIKKVGNLYDLFVKAKSDKELLAIIVDNFQNFRDMSLYDGKKVYFFKRATLLVDDLYQNVPEIRENIQNTNGLNACADYKIPQVLRQLGILEYSEELAQIVDDEQELKSGSEMEVEIRASMIYVIELIKQELRRNDIEMNSIEIDNALWLLSKKEDFKSKPHHLTKTIYY